VYEAVAAWRRFPREIASDLSRYHGRRIAEWHRYPAAGDLSSYELLELLEFMDDDGEYKKACRGGEWSDRQWAVFAAANEAAVLRAGQVRGADGDVYGARMFIPPSIVRETRQRAEEAQDARAQIFAMADISRQLSR
jgi:hypothetical protein